MQQYDGLTKDTNAAIKALLFQIEEAAGQPPEQALHPYEMARRRKEVIKLVWGFVRRCMSVIEKQPYGD